MSASLDSMTIGQLADRAGVNVETVRFYQRRGLMTQPERPPGGIRRYSSADVSRVSFIKASQRLGFSLDEIGELLLLDDGSTCSKARVHAERKLADVRTKISSLRQIESALARLVVQCTTAQGTVRCPLIESLRTTRSQV